MVPGLLLGSSRVVIDDPAHCTATIKGKAISSWTQEGANNRVLAHHGEELFYLRVFVENFHGENSLESMLRQRGVT